MVLEDYRVGLIAGVIVVELSAWLEVIRYQFITLANKFFNLVSSAVINRFISVTINCVRVLQVFTSLAINVLDYSTLGIGTVLNDIDNITVAGMIGSSWNLAGISSIALKSWTGYSTGLLTGNC